MHVSRSWRPVSLARFNGIHWITAEEDVWTIPEYLVGIAHTPILRAGMDRKLNRMDPRLYAAGRMGAAK